MATVKTELDKVVSAMVDLSNKWEYLAHKVDGDNTRQNTWDNLTQAYQETDKLGTMDFEEWITRFQLWRDRYQELQDWTEPR